MATKTIRIGVELDTETNRRVERWSEAEGRSKRRHAEIIFRRIGELMEEQPNELARLGLIGPTAIKALTH